MVEDPDPSRADRAALARWSLLAWQNPFEDAGPLSAFFAGVEEITRAGDDDAPTGNMPSATLATMARDLRRALTVSPNSIWKFGLVVVLALHLAVPVASAQVVPDEPQNLTAARDTSTTTFVRVALTWDTPDNTGDSPITDVCFRYRPYYLDPSYTEPVCTPVSDLGGVNKLISPHLEAGTLYEFNIALQNDAGLSSWAWVRFTPGFSPVLAARPTSVAEDAEAKSVTVTVTLGETVTLTRNVPVTVSVGGGTATAGTDYAAVEDFTVTVLAGSLSATGAFTLTPIDDDVAEGNETIEISATATDFVNIEGAEVTIADDDDGRGISVSPKTLTLAEADDTGTSATEENKATYTVKLDSQPTGTVTVTLASGDQNVATASPATLTFTAQDYAAKTVTVTAVADTLDNAGGKRTTTITHTVSAAGTDYAGESADSVTVEVTDDDDGPSGAITLVANPDSLAESASATTVTVTATLPGRVARDTDTAITVKVGDSGDAATEGTDYGTVDDFTLTVDAGKLSGTRTFSLDPTQDAIDEGAGETLSVSGSTAVSGLTVGSDQITITDDDAAPTAVTLTASPDSVTENGGARTVTVTATVTGTTRFAAKQTVAVTVGKSGDSATSGTDYEAVTGFNVEIAAGASSGAKTFTLTPTDDTLDESEESLSVEGTLSGVTVTGDTIAITDDDGRGISVSPKTLTLAEADDTGTSATEENKATYTVKLDSQPTGTVTVTLASGDQNVATASPATLTFTAQDYAAKTVTVTAVADTLDNAGGKRTTTITHTVSAAGTDYAGESADSVTVEVTDDDDGPSGAITLVANPDSLAESASATTVTVTATLPGRVARDTDTAITVKVGDSGDAATEGTDYGTVDDFTLTVDAGKLSGTRTFSLDPTQDAIDEGAGETLSVSGSTAVSGLTVGSDQITITDDDAAPTAVTLTASPDSVTENGGARTVTVTATVTGTTRFAAKQTVAVTVGKSGDSATSGTDYEAVTGFNVEIAAGASSGAKTFTLTPTDDTLDESEESLSVEGTLSGVTVTGDTIAITDDDGRGISVSPKTLTLAEADDTGTSATEENKATYTVKLDSQPTGTVTVTLASGDQNVATASPATLTFTAQDYAAKTVTVTAVADTLDNAGGKRTTTITHTVSAAGTDYAGESADSVTVEVTDDDDGPSGAITLVANPDSLAESASATTVTVTATLPGRVARDTDTAITVKVGDSGDAATEGTDYGTVDDFTLTVDAGKLSGTRTFSLDPTQDAIDEGAGETLSVSGSTAVSGLTVGSDQITITDDDAAATRAITNAPEFMVAVDPDEIEEAGGVSTITVSTKDGVTSRDDQTIALTLSGTATKGDDYTIAALSLSLKAGETSVSTRITAVEDVIDEDNETVIVTASHDSIEIRPAQTITITDDDTKGVAVIPTSLTVAESDDATTTGTRENEATYTVVLMSEPTGRVTVSMTSSAEDVATVVPQLVRFTAENWNRPQTVTVSSVDGALDNAGGKREAQVTHMVSGGDYAGLTAATVSVQVKDDQVVPIPQAWLARFGRTVTAQVLDAIKVRLAAPRKAGARATLAGQALLVWTPDARSPTGGSAGRSAATPGPVFATNVADDEAIGSIGTGFAQAGSDSSRGAWEDDEHGLSMSSRTMTQRELLAVSSFALTGEARDASFASLWGRGAYARFDGREGALSLDGEVTTGLVGTDWATTHWTAGLAVSHSQGEGSWRTPSGGGKIKALLTGLYPYAGVMLTERLSVWMAAGYGTGEVTVTPEGKAVMKADLDLAMAAAGLRGEIARPPAHGNGFALAVTSDARFTRTSSDEGTRGTGGGADANEAVVWLARASIEGSRRFAIGEDGNAATLTQSLEFGLRIDGGDAEEGFGAELSGGLAFENPDSGLFLDLKVHGLVLHEATGFQEWGASASLGFDPSTGSERGLSLSLRLNWGSPPAGAMDALLNRETMASFTANDNVSEFGDGGRLDGELGYGLPAFGGAFTGIPNLGFALSDSGTREWRIGWRLISAVRGDPGIEVSLDATRREAANDDAPGHGVMLRALIRW